MFGKCWMLQRVTKNDFAKGDGVRVQSVGKKHPLYDFWHVLICLKHFWNFHRHFSSRLNWCKVMLVTNIFVTKIKFINRKLGKPFHLSIFPTTRTSKVAPILCLVDVVGKMTKLENLSNYTYDQVFYNFANKTFENVFIKIFFRISYFHR